MRSGRSGIGSSVRRHLNKIKLLDGTAASGIRVQVAQGTEGGIALSLGEKLMRSVGDGTFTLSSSFSAGGWPNDVLTTDLNGDGLSDVVVANPSTTRAVVLLGIQGGGLGTATSYNIGTGAPAYSTPVRVSVADVNGDGKSDIITANNDLDTFSVLLGNGDGSFRAAISTTSGPEVRAAEARHLDGDGILDMVVSNSGNYTVSFFLGNGDGTYRSRGSMALAYFDQVTVGDVNGDGISDVLASTGDLEVYLGNVDASFRSARAYSHPGNVNEIKIVDLNGDGRMDIVGSDWSAGVAYVNIGNGDGSFSAARSFTSLANPWKFKAQDINDDGAVDLVVMSGSGTGPGVTLLGNGDGTFKAAMTAWNPGSNTLFAIDISDFNRDGIQDALLGIGDTGRVGIFSANTTSTSSYGAISLLSVEGARSALGVAERARDRVLAELGACGAIQSRLETALRTLSIQRENSIAASARITNLDIAEESSHLVSTQIKQQSATAVLAQANQSPSLVLKLLER